MKISILTLFPSMFKGVFDESIIKRAKEKKLIEIEYINIRDFGIGKHKVVDDTPYGGGVGMVIRVDVIERALNRTRCKNTCNELVILTDARGKTFNQERARELTKIDHLIIICGHYEAIDERVTELIDEKISIGDYVLTGGEIPAMVITETVARLIPRVLSKEDAILLESFSDAFYLEHPHFTKPREWHGKEVPTELLSGNHKEIKKWKVQNSLKKSSP